ncbi:MAG: DUF3791 domain-containing protein [Thermoguttaceae bacterium]
MDANIEDNVLEFVAFCIENYKVKNGVSGGDAKRLFDTYGVVDYLVRGYDVLHTQGKDYIIVDIEEFIENRKHENVSRKS